jgi:hypothetical protein
MLFVHSFEFQSLFGQVVPYTRAYLAKANLRIVFQSLFAQVVLYNSAVKCVACGE